VVEAVTFAHAHNKAPEPAPSWTNGRVRYERRTVSELEVGQQVQFFPKGQGPVSGNTVWTVHGVTSRVLGVTSSAVRLVVVEPSVRKPHTPKGAERSFNVADLQRKWDPWVATHISSGPDAPAPDDFWEPLGS
jgi:hypothetical protein